MPKTTEYKGVSDNIKQHILSTYVEPSYEYDVKDMIIGRKCWKKTGQVFETMSKILVAAGGILSFASGYYDNYVLGFVAGSVSTVSLALLQLSSFSFRENKRLSSELNIILKDLDIKSIPVLARQTEENNYTTYARETRESQATYSNRINNQEPESPLRNTDSPPSPPPKAQTQEQLYSSRPSTPKPPINTRQHSLGPVYVLEEDYNELRKRYENEVYEYNKRFDEGAKLHEDMKRNYELEIQALREHIIQQELEKEKHQEQFHNEKKEEVKEETQTSYLTIHLKDEDEYNDYETLNTNKEEKKE